MEYGKRFYLFWIGTGIYYGVFAGAVVGPFLEIYALGKQNYLKGHHLDLDSPFLATGAILTGAPSGAFLGATLPIWAPYFLVARYVRWISCPIYSRNSGYSNP